MEKRTEKNIIRIAITGPESTGKSALAECLAVHYNTVWIPEYAREYLGKLDRPYNQDDILQIAKGQFESEKKQAFATGKFIFSDTELIVTKIWSDVKYGNCDKWILDNIDEQKFDLYLLCNIDLPWEFDVLREHPEQREYLMKLYINELFIRKLNYAVISGNGEQRVNNAISIIEKLL
jgi:NadR type nicotinamide-nucleotide adenylyltransferase